MPVGFYQEFLTFKKLEAKIYKQARLPQVEHLKFRKQLKMRQTFMGLFERAPHKLYFPNRVSSGIPNLSTVGGQNMKTNSIAEG